jgi:T4 RnlA family RNA ligase
MDGNRNIVSRPFPKFFNYGELELAHQNYLDSRSVAQRGDFTVTEKMDGSLGVSYFDPQGKMYIATRGSFVSEQARKANELLSKYYKPYWDSDYTYLFEIIYPSNRIVVNYGDKEELVLLSIIETKSGRELNYDTVNQWVSDYDIPVVPRYDGITDFNQIEQKQNSEGYVVHFPDTGLRFKLKFDEYVRLHKIVTGINAKRVWELLSTNTPFDDILERVPDEFYQWVQKTRLDLKSQYTIIENAAIDVFTSVQDIPTRKDQALAIKDSPYRGIVFNMLDSKPHEKIIWKMIEPELERPFKEDEA